MPYAYLDRTAGDGVTQLVLDRPDKLNAMNPELLRDFGACLDELSDDEETRCVVIRGEGRAFSVGFDVQRTGEGPPTHAQPYEDWRRLRRSLELWLRVWDLDRPVVAAVHGHCLGGATLLSVCCDITIVGESTRVGWPTLPLGGGLLGPASLWMVGSKRARELSYTVGSSMVGAEAVDAGWANRAVAEVDVLDESLALAREIARIPLRMLRIKKLAMNRVMESQGFRTAFLYGAEWDAIAHAAPEHAVVREEIAARGLKGAVQWFADGGELRPDADTPGPDRY